MVQIGNPDWFYIQLPTDANVWLSLWNMIHTIFMMPSIPRLLFFLSFLSSLCKSFYPSIFSSFLCSYVFFLYSFSLIFLLFYWWPNIFFPLACSSTVLSFNSVSENETHREKKCNEIAGNCFRRSCNVTLV